MEKIVFRASELSDVVKGKSFDGFEIDMEIVNNVKGVKFVECLFTDTTFINTIFENCVFEDCTFNKVGFSVATKLIGCEFNNCNIMYSGFRPSMALIKSSFEDCDIQHCTINSLCYSEVAINDCKMSDVTFKGLTMIKPKIENSELVSVAFSSCEMSTGSFKDTNFVKTDIIDCKISNTRFKDAGTLRGLYPMRSDIDTDFLHFTTEGVRLCYLPKEDICWGSLGEGCVSDIIDKQSINTPNLVVDMVLDYFSKVADTFKNKEL